MNYRKLFWNLLVKWGRKSKSTPMFEENPSNPYNAFYLHPVASQEMMQYLRRAYGDDQNDDRHTRSPYDHPFNGDYPW